MWHNYSRITSTLMIALVLAPHVVALTPRVPFSNTLVSRQSPVGGTACTSACGVFINALDECKSVDCLCNTAVAAGLQNCVNCAVSSNPTSNTLTSAQGLITTYGAACSGVSLPTVTIPSVPNGGSTSQATATTSVFTPISSNIQSDTSTAVILPSVTTPINTPTSIVQTIIQSSAVTGSATGPTGGSVVNNSAIGRSAPGMMVLGLHLVVGCILGALLAF